MKYNLLLAISISALSIAGCKSSDDDGNTADFNTVKQQVITDFTARVAVPAYQDLSLAANDLNTALQNLNTSSTESNLQTARNKWKEMRAIWEKCEGFLFGPVDDNGYDPNMDTWPTDYVQMDSLLASATGLQASNIQNFTLSLRGYHPIEYIIFGDHGNRTAASLTARQKQYMAGLSEDLKATCNALLQSWIAAPENFGKEVTTAGAGSTKYAKKQEVYLALTEGLIGICEEVGEGKMKEPFDAQDPTIVESPYSGNSATDFKNNIIGAQNVYLGRYKEDGNGINELVALRNKALDNKLQAQLTAAINSFDNITVPFEQAIITQRVQVQSTMDALAALKTTLDEELKPFVLQYITD